MHVDTMLPLTALVVIDLQKGITALPTVQPADGVVAQSARLATAFREHSLPVVLVNTAFSPGGADALKLPTDAHPPAVKLAGDRAVATGEIQHALGLAGHRADQPAVRRVVPCHRSGQQGFSAARSRGVELSQILGPVDRVLRHCG